MILTGKAKEDFEKWTQNTHDDCGNGQTGKRLFYIESIDDYKFIKTEHYIHNIGDSMLHALIIEWFDSVGIYITIEGVFDRMLGYHRGYEVHIYQDGKQPISLFDNEDVFNIRQEAAKQAIIKANQVYNDR